MALIIQLSGQKVKISDEIFDILLGNTIAADYAAFQKAEQTGSISWADLLYLIKIANVPTPLFFAPVPFVEQQVKRNRKLLLDGVRKSTYSVNGRGEIKIEKLQLIIKDLGRKQEFLKSQDTSLTKNVIVDCLKHRPSNPKNDAGVLLSHLDLTHDMIQSAGTNEKALAQLITALEAHQIFVSQSAHNFMPQQVTNLGLSGITIRDKKIPYIFLAGGKDNDDLEPTGRRIFTLVLLLTLIARGIFAPVSFGTWMPKPIAKREVAITAEFLLPESEMSAISLTSIEEVKSIARIFHVTPSALVVRALELGILNRDSGTSYLDDLAHEFSQKPSAHGGPSKPATAIPKYAGHEFTRRMLNLLDRRSITTSDFLRVACLNKLDASAINDLRG